MSHPAEVSKSVRVPGFYLGYGIGDYGLNLFWNTMSLILVFWYAEVVGIEAHIAGIIYFLGMLWDGVSDPIVASIAEQHRSRFGGYRPFLLFGGVALSLSFCLLFWVPPFRGILLILYLAITHIVFRTCYTLVAVPYSALTSRLTRDSRERTLLSGVRMFCAFMGMLTITYFWFPLSRYFGGGDETSAIGVFITAAIAAVLAYVALFICFLFVDEKIVAQREPVRISRVFANFRQALTQNSALRILLIAIATLSAATTTFSITLAFFLEANQTSLARKETVMSALAILTLLAVPIWTWLARRISRKAIWICATLIVAINGIMAAFFGMIAFNGLPLQIMGMGFGFAAFAVIMWAIIPDIVEFGEHAYGVRSEAAVFGSVLLGQKLVNGAMGLVVGFFLKTIGYDAERELQTETVAQGLEVYISLLPVLMLVLSAIAIWRLPFDEDSHAEMVRSLNRETVQTESQKETT